MRRRLAVPPAAALLAAALLAACSSTTAGTGSATPAARPAPATRSAQPQATISSPVNPDSIDPCGLLTKTEADAVAGTTTMKPVRTKSLCTFATPTTGSVGQVEVYVGDGAKKQFDIDKVTLQHDFTRVGGIGDEAWLEDANIFVRSGGTWVSLRVTRLDTVDTGPLLEQAAARVVGRLP